MKPLVRLAIFTLGIVVSCVSAEDNTATTPETNPPAAERPPHLQNLDKHVLRFKEDGSFKIVQFTDLHMGEPNGTENDLKTQEVMKAVLEHEAEVDLVVFSGDMVSGMKWDGQPKWLEELWPKVISAVTEKQVPYTFINGNHDTMGNLNADQLQAFDRSKGSGSEHQVRLLSVHTASPATMGSRSSRSNFWLPIMSNSSTTIQAILWGIDSESIGCQGMSNSWGCVHPSALGWVSQQTEFMPRVPSLAFQHIPPEEFVTMWNQGGDELKGTRGAGVQCSLLNTASFTTLRTAGVQAIYSGHDHMNDFIGEYNGVRLAYGRKTGYGSTGPLPGVTRGARVIQLQEGESAAKSQTWFRLESGEKEDDRAKNDVHAQEHSDQNPQFACPELNSKTIREKATERMKKDGILDQKGEINRVSSMINQMNALRNIGQHHGMRKPNPIPGLSKFSPEWMRNIRRRQAGVGQPIHPNGASPANADELKTSMMPGAKAPGNASMRPSDDPRVGGVEAMRARAHAAALARGAANRVKNTPGAVQRPFLHPKSGEMHSQMARQAEKEPSGDGEKHEQTEQPKGDEPSDSMHESGKSENDKPGDENKPENDNQPVNEKQPESEEKQGENKDEHNE